MTGVQKRLSKVVVLKQSVIGSAKEQVIFGTVSGEYRTIPMENGTVFLPRITRAGLLCRFSVHQTKFILQFGRCLQALQKTLHTAECYPVKAKGVFRKVAQTAAWIRIFGIDVYK